MMKIEVVNILLYATRYEDDYKKVVDEICDRIVHSFNNGDNVHIYNLAQPGYKIIKNTLQLVDKDMDNKNIRNAVDSISQYIWENACADYIKNTIRDVFDLGNVGKRDAINIIIIDDYYTYMDIKDMMLGFNKLAIDSYAYDTDEYYRDAHDEVKLNEHIDNIIKEAFGDGNC